MTSRLRHKEWKDYAALNSGTSKKRICKEVDVLAEQELVEEEDLDYLDVEADEDEFLEDGEIEEDEEELEDEYEHLISKYSAEGNVIKLKKILELKKKKCENLQIELEAEQQREKDREIQDILDEMSKVNKAKLCLEKSLASSRASTPCSSPGRRKTQPKSTVKVAMKAKPRVTMSLRGTKQEVGNKKINEEKSEYKELLNTFLSLKQGKGEAYSELVEEAMTATDNILKLKKQRNKSPAGDNQNSAFKGKLTIDDCDSASECERDDDHREDALKLVQALQSAVKENKQLDSNTINCVLESIVHSHEHTSKVNNTKKDKGSEINENRERINQGSEYEGAVSNEDKKKKLVSGKCTKPDETDIKCVVQFAHGRLDSRHTTSAERVFDKLSSNLLVAGELEIASLNTISEAERLARVNIAKTVSYHRAYLKDADIRNGYDHVLKNVEQGKWTWSDDLGEKLHSHYDYQANKLARERMQGDGGTRTVKHATAINVNTEKAVEPNGTIYCGLYNKGTCLHPDHHEGRFSNKAVTKWHICSKCFKAGERKSHREIDECCPNKA